MAMFTSVVSRSLRDLQRADHATAGLARRLITGNQLNTPADGPPGWLAAARAGSTSGFLDALHAGLNEAAVSIRTAGQTMQAIAEHLRIMQGQVEQALQYPAGDPARDQLIADFNAVYRQISDLVNTTSPPGARTLMTGGSMDILVGLAGERRTVNGQPVYPGNGGLNLPLLDVANTAAELRQALVDVTAAQSTLAARRQGLSVDTANISRYEARNVQVSGFYRSRAEALAVADPAEAAVKMQSVGIQRSLAMETLGGISALQDAVLELLR